MPTSQYIFGKILFKDFFYLIKNIKLYEFNNPLDKVLIFSTIVPNSFHKTAKFRDILPKQIGRK